MKKHEFVKFNEFQSNLHNCTTISKLLLNGRITDLFLDRKIYELSKVPTALEFSRDFVGKNRPVIIRGACSKWQATSKWNAEFFRYSNIHYFLGYRIFHYIFQFVEERMEAS